MSNRFIETATLSTKMKERWPIDSSAELPFDKNGITVILFNMRFKYDKKKSDLLRKDPRRKIGFEEVREIWEHAHYVDWRSDDPAQFRVIGWVKNTLYPVIYEIREDKDGEYCHLVTLWKSTKQERELYEENI